MCHMSCPAELVLAVMSSCDVPRVAPRTSCQPNLRVRIAGVKRQNAQGRAQPGGDGVCVSCRGRDEDVFRAGSVRHGFTCTMVSQALGYTRTYTDRSDPGEGDLTFLGAREDDLLHVLHSRPVLERQRGSEESELLSWIRLKAMSNELDRRMRRNRMRNTRASYASAKVFRLWPTILNHRRRRKHKNGSHEKLRGRTVQDGAGPYCPLRSEAICRLQYWFPHLLTGDTDCGACRTYPKGTCVPASVWTKNNPLEGEVFKRLCPENQALSGASGRMVTRRRIVDTDGGSWLNDELINAYLGLVEARSNRFSLLNAGGESVLAFSSYFYNKLTIGGRYDYEQVAEWLEKVVITHYDRIFIPINHNNSHWSLCVVEVQRRVIRHLDSIHGQKLDIMDNIRKWFLQRLWRTLQMELHDKDVVLEIHEKPPQQKNTSDCGVFVCKFADFISKNLVLDFTHDHMPYFRARMADELLVGYIA